MYLHGCKWGVFLLLAVAGCESTLPIMELPPANRDCITRLQQADEPLKTQRLTPPTLTLPPADTAKPVTEDRTAGVPVPVGDSKISNRPRAQVNGVFILDDEIRDTIAPALAEIARMPEPARSQKQKEVWKDTLNGLIDREIILKEIYRRFPPGTLVMDKLTQAAEQDFEKNIRGFKEKIKAQSEDELRAAISASGQSYEVIKKRQINQFLSNEYMRSRIFNEIERKLQDHRLFREYYDEHLDQFQAEDRIKWKDIFVDAGKYPDRAGAKAAAESIAARAKRGEDFTSLAAQFNQGPTGKSADGQGERRGEIQPADAETVLFQLKSGDVGPVLELPTGFHVIKLIEREYAGQRPFDDKVQLEIRKKLQIILADREYKKIMAELRRKATIQIIDNDP